MKKAIITGVTGQDGSYLAELLLSKGYEVHGLIRKSSTFNTQRIEHLYKDLHSENVRLFLHYADLADSAQITHLVYEISPDEVYHLGAQSHVQASFEMPELTGNYTGLGSVRFLEAMKRSGVKARFYQASSSEMFGAAPAPQNEKTPFYPRSPYGAAKVYAYWMAVNYREAYGMFAANGILFNHESPRRGETFVTRKITRGIAGILKGDGGKIYLGNLDAKRDWGYAPEYVEAMWKILQFEKPMDFVIGTGETHTVREFLSEAFSYVGLDWENHISIDPRYFRPTEVDLLLADASQAKKLLQWEPKIRFQDLVHIMVDHDLEGSGLTSPGRGKSILSLNGFSGWTTNQVSLIQGYRA